MKGRPSRVQRLLTAPLCSARPRPSASFRLPRDGELVVWHTAAPLRRRRSRVPISPCRPRPFVSVRLSTQDLLPAPPTLMRDPVVTARHPLRRLRRLRRRAARWVLRALDDVEPSQPTFFSLARVRMGDPGGTSRSLALGCAPRVFHLGCGRSSRDPPSTQPTGDEPERLDLLSVKPAETRRGDKNLPASCYLG
jgi:hypothetical protein